VAHDSSLEPVLRAVEPAARLVPERHLRQILNHLADLGAALPTNPALPYWVSRTDLLESAVLPSHVLAGNEPALLLLTDPNDRMIDHLPRESQLRVYWEALFQAGIMQRLDRRLEAGALTPEICQKRLNQFGASAAREIRYVLESEHLLSHEAAGRTAEYRAFAAVYLATATFHQHRLEALFPSLPHGNEVKLVLEADFDAAELLARARPAGAATPDRELEPDERWETADPITPPPMELSAEESGGLLGQALEAERKGNNVRAAILRTQVAGTTPGKTRKQILAGARSSLGKLVDSLGEMFSWDHHTRQEWLQALTPLLDSAYGGVWPRAARCLYELQKIPADLSREVYAVDLAEAIRTFGKRPVKRPLPRAKPVLILMGLRRAHAQLIRTQIGPIAKLRLDRLFQHQLHELEHKIRHDFTPIVAAALTQSGLIATNTVELVARDKLISELIDRVCSRGYLRIGDLRDAIARNRLKMPDLRGPVDFLSGDPLLKADLLLAYELDGIYRKGEFYLRWLQRASSLFFANPVGRGLFLFLFLPCAGAFMTVVAAQEMSHIGEKIYKFAARTLVGKPPTAAIPPPEPVVAPKPVFEPPDGKATTDEVEVDEETGDYIWDDAPHPANLVREVFSPTEVNLTKEGSHGNFHVPWEWVGGLAVFLFLMIHVPAFRTAVLALLTSLWRTFRFLLIDIPIGIWRSPVVRSVRISPPVRLLRRYLWSPLLITGIVFAFMMIFGTNPRFLARWGWLIWGGLTLAYNTPWGWVLQDRLAEAVSDWWRVVRVNLIPGIIATFIDWFRRLGNWIEQRLYAVDERLRFRGGDSQGSLVWKALIGLIWFPIAYLFRFAFYLLLEPQINPVKHFPVVTVSHKLLLPLVPSFGELLEKMTGWGVAKANVWAFSIIACVPGIFGFIAWELLANWRLYAANRSRKLNPVVLGSHGETMRGLLCPGFHSGAIPKLFRRLRNSDGANSSRLHHELEHAEEAVHRFFERELIHLLAHSPDWSGVNLQVSTVSFGCQSVTVEVLAPAVYRDPFRLSFENRDGRIEAHVDQQGWVERLSVSQRNTFFAGLRGVLDMAAADRVDGQIRREAASGAGELVTLSHRVSWAEWGQRWNRTETTKN